jgi:hypothetical protein
MIYFRSDREVLIRFDEGLGALLHFEVEWNDDEGGRHYVTWDGAKGFDAGLLDIRHAFDGGAKVALNPSVLGQARRIVESAELERPIQQLVLTVLSADGPAGH